MTDNDIIKALEYCAYREGCENCPITRGCDGYVHLLGALDLINSQKAEIERLEMDNAQLQSNIINANMNCDHLLAEVEK